MANYVTFKKKFSVPVFVVLLIFAFVPGIIYFIWSRFPIKINTDPNKSTGAKMRVISAAVAFGAWLIVTLWLSFMNFGEMIFLSFVWQLLFSLASLVLAIVNKKNNKLLFILNILFAVLTMVFSTWMFYYNWFVSVIAPIFTIVGCVNGIRHYNYHVKGKRPEDDEDEDEDEDEE